MKKLPQLAVVLFLCLPMACEATAAELAKMEVSPKSPILLTLGNKERLTWGRWFTDYIPGECYSHSPGGCKEYKAYIIVDFGDEDTPQDATYATERAHKWNFLGSRGALPYLIDPESDSRPLVVRLLKENYKETYRYEVCAANVGYKSASIECVPMEKGIPKASGEKLAEIKPDLSLLIHLDRLYTQDYYTSAITVYSRTETKEGPTEGDSRHLSRIFIAQVSSDGRSKLYATPQGQNWRSVEILDSPRPPETTYLLQLARDEGDGTPVKLCTVRVGIEAAVIEECAELLPVREDEKSGRSEPIKAAPPAEH